MFLIGIGQSTTFIEMRNECHQRGPSGLEKHQTFEFSLPVGFLRIFEKLAIFDFFFWKIQQCAP